MCLETGWSKPRVAKEDITVYKALTIERIGLEQELVSEGKIVKAYAYALAPQSYTTRKKYVFGKLNVVRNGFTSYRSGRTTSVNRGFHSFANRQSALNLAGIRTMAVECKIPKGSLYWKGTNNGTSDGYCSNKLIVVKQILS